MTVRIADCGLRIADWIRPLGVLAMCFLVAGAAAAADVDSLRSKQQAQEKARSLATELVSAVLDIQLRQLEENGLKSLPIYRDIASMKGNIGELAKDQMEEIVQLLVEAQEGTQAERLVKFNAARGKIREVVVQLMAERQKLYRRMQIAKLAAQVRELIVLETKAYNTTKSLPELKQDVREQLALATIEDQADVQKLYFQLVFALEDVSTWGGQIGAGASDGLRILRAAQVDPELKKAADLLGKAEFPEAAKSQYAVIKGLMALLEKLEQTQGLIDSDREEALRMVREMLKKQQALREKTKQEELTEKSTEPLIEAQTNLQKELGKLAEALTKFPTTEPLLEEAKAASFEATADLFEEKKAEALEDQNKVIGNLAQIEKVLEQGLDLEQSGKSADELAAEVQKLQEAKKQLETAAAEQAKATEAAKQNPAAVKPQEQKVAEELAKTDAMELPSAVEAKVNDAQEAVAEAAEAAADTAAEKAEEAMDAIKQAQAEVAAQLADKQRMQKAVEVGELARAAEALERAAAAEREIAKEAGEAAKEKGLEAAQANDLATDQKDVNDVAAKIAEGVKNTAPEAAQTLAQAKPSAEEAGKQLEAAKQNPGEPSKPAAEKAAGEAIKTADKLAEAAKELRKQAGAKAGELAKLADEQLKPVESARAAVEDAAENAPANKAEALESSARPSRKSSRR
ncbi:MAG TPA: hypothetical protein VFV87_21920 [Pirellulaceae bacterium]|nr:hypothetical protein [Pirellulaceae bacterium]